MAIHTQHSLSGFIASEPRLTFSDKGVARMWVKVGQNHYRPEPDGSFTELEPTFHDLVAFRATAERAAARFVKGDQFIAEGFIRDGERLGPDGETIKTEEFVAKKIGHDLARTTYAVERRTRTAPDMEPPIHERQAPANATPAMAL
jgi:single-stranded DNA-binding protein